MQNGKASLPDLLRSPDLDSLREKLVPLPKGMLDPRVGVATIPGRGPTIVCADALSPPVAWDQVEQRWVHLITRS